jgi:GNAT superfamily N-acetyltransferase
MNDGVALSITQFLAAWGLFGDACPGARVENGDGVGYMFTGLPIPFFNVAVLTGPQLSRSELGSRARAAIEWASDTGAPWLFVVTHETLESDVDAAAVLGACELTPLLPMTGMVARHIAPVARASQDVELAVPQDDAGFAAMIDVNSAAYGMDLSPAKPAFGTSAFWTGHVPVLGRAGGTAATSAAVLMSGGHRYVGLVATDPGFRKRGLAEAAMRLALDVAAQRHGDLPTFLHATDAGRPIYARMGYQPVAAHTCFIEKRFMAGH